MQWQLIESVVMCSECPLSDINLPNSMGWTPLHFACNKGPSHFAIIRELVQLGADVRKLTNSNDTALQYVDLWCIL